MRMQLSLKLKNLGGREHAIFDCVELLCLVYMFINFQSSIFFFQPVIVVVVILFKNIYMDQPMNLVNLPIIGRRKMFN